ncbi:MAG: glycosyltransferase family 2 protein [Elusimicrobia bacterium]|nr:glycosyltransferase family 2 protein [Elusimicrobiota bacterium]
MRRALVLLTFNEIEALPKIFDEIPRHSAQEFFAVDGGSLDGTRQFLEGKGLRVLDQPRRGRGVAFRVAAEATSAEALVFFSPDGNEDPADIPRLFEKLEEGYDMAIASRMMKGAFNEEDAQCLRPRKWVNQAFTLIANILWNRGSYITDAINGFRAVRRSAFAKMACDADGFVIEYQMSIRAMKEGLRVAEIATREGQRLGGKSTAKSLPTGMVFIRQLAREMLGVGQ